MTVLLVGTLCARDAALRDRLITAEKFQLCFEVTGAFDLLAMINCPHMAAYNQLADSILTADPTVRRYETHFVKREVKFAPFVRLGTKGAD
jgi:DNA-binding Lrp family transcriptional regulator